MNLPRPIVTSGDFVASCIVAKRLIGSGCLYVCQVYKQRSEQYGPIYKETFGDISTVVISDLDEYDKVIAVDGRYPNRFELQPIVHYRNKRRMGLGIVNGSLLFTLRRRSSRVLKGRTRSHPEIVGDMSRVTLNFDLSKIPFVHF